MQMPLRITMREAKDPTGAIKKKIQERVEKLEQLHSNIISCEVVVDEPHHAHHKGNLYSVRINLSLPQHKLVVSSEDNHNHEHEDVYVALRDTFDSMTREIEKLVHIQRGNVKTHATHPIGTISMLVPENNYGRIVTDEDHDVYFHRNSVKNYNFDKLTMGMDVELEYEMGDQGLQATFVKVLSE